MITGIKITGRRGVRDRVKDGDGSRLPMRKPGGDYGKDLRPWSMGVGGYTRSNAYLLHGYSKQSVIFSTQYVDQKSAFLNNDF